MEFPAQKQPAKPVGAVPVQVRRWHALTSQAVKAVLRGKAPAELPPLDLTGGTEFQQRVWKELRKIRAGQTKSYGEIAAALGKKGGARAVGGACGANPVPVIVPCHRVLASGGALGGFSGGLDWKRRLLRREKTKVEAD